MPLFSVGGRIGDSFYEIIKKIQLNIIVIIGQIENSQNNTWLPLITQTAADFMLSLET